MLSHVLSGYETNVPVDSMQGLEIGSQHGSTYGPVDNLADMGPPPGDLNFENLESTLPQDSQGMAWFDTDLWNTSAGKWRMTVPEVAFISFNREGDAADGPFIAKGE